MAESYALRPYRTPDQRLLALIERVRTMEPPAPEISSAEYEQGWQDACERIQELWLGGDNG